MTNTKKWAVAVLAIAAGLSGCASTRVAPSSALEAAEAHQVSRPAPSYGSLGGYRYRRLVVTTVAGS